MVKLKRLGVVLEPEWKVPKTFAKFNAGMTLTGDIVHMVYRYAVWKSSYDPRIESNYAMDDIRYARLTPEGKLVYESKKPLISPSLAWDYSGCQDARIIPFEGAYYLIYAGWDKDIAKDNSRPRVCVARTYDFETVEKLGVINNFVHDKDAFIFPERINGKVAYVHRVSPNIQIEYFDSIEAMLDPKFWDAYNKDKAEASTVMKAAFPWECGKIGGSVPPVRTDKGWLFIYHAVEVFPGNAVRPFIYRAGAALMDLENPSKVIARLPYPILEPEEDYELFGDVNNVVFPVGGYVYKGELYVSYGAADRCVALAKIQLDELLDELEKYPV